MIPSIGKGLIYEQWKPRSDYRSAQPGQDFLYSIAPDKSGTQKLFFLCLHENICCEYSLEEPHWGTSNEYP